MIKPIRFLLDNNAPDSIRRLLEDQTVHKVIAVRDHLMEDASDGQIASTAVEDDLIIITHDRDFRRYLPQFGNQSGGVVRVRTSEPAARHRIEAALDMLEFHISDCRSRDIRPRLDLGTDYIIIHNRDTTEFRQVEAAFRFHFERSRVFEYEFVSEVSPRYWKFTERRRKKQSAS